MILTTDDIRISHLDPITSPALLLSQHPLPSASARDIIEYRKTASDIIHGLDDRLLVVVGPCSIHDVAAALEYAEHLAKAREVFKDELHIIMRVYFEKPRTTVGWKGLINDPNLDNSFDINQGLVIARKLLVDLTKMQLPIGTEFLDVIIPQYISDVVSWGAIGARTTESQVHRELASGLSMPVGFKNGTDGNIKIAIDAIRSAHGEHHFLSVSKLGVPVIVGTKGNTDTHVILRGASNGPNYDAEHVANTVKLLAANQLQQRIMIDCSHGNSQKDHNKQPLVAQNIADQIAKGSESICGVMIESNLVAGHQALTDKQHLKYGQSITDACIDWQATYPVLENLAQAIIKRRAK
ncbi:MAG: 3-deoxy-7-phosphoheptulonate synthase [Gammaproteobacteria bacterium]|jgi:3-deoxy-7-phosphoheptulonate synthase